MPRRIVYEESSDSDNEIQKVEEEDEQLPTLEEELNKVTLNKKMELELKNAKAKALDEKRALKQQPKKEKLKTGGATTPRFQKGSAEAREWSQKMREAKTKKRQETVTEKQKLHDLEEQAKRLLFESKEQEIKSLKAQLTKLKNIEQKISEPEPEIVKTPRRRRIKTHVISDSEDTDNDPSVIQAKKHVRRQKIEKAAASEYIQSEQAKIRQEMLNQYKSAIFGN